MAAPGPSSASVADFCALPGLPDGRSAEDAAREALECILRGADGATAAMEIVNMYQAEAAARGEEEVLGEQTLEVLLTDDFLCDEIITLYAPEIGDLAEFMNSQHGWPKACFLRCKCKKRCFVDLATASPAVLDEHVERLYSAKERAAGVKAAPRSSVYGTNPSRTSTALFSPRCSPSRRGRTRRRRPARRSSRRRWM
jgi:hypothetical protein